MLFTNTKLSSFPKTMTVPKNTENASHRSFTSATFVQDDNKKAPFPVILSVSEGSPQSDGSFSPLDSGKTYGPVLVAAGDGDRAALGVDVDLSGSAAAGCAAARIARQIG
jgi:hypothetical protein